MASGDEPENSILTMLIFMQIPTNLRYKDVFS